ncbi:MULTISPECIES: CBS domain-containing protein [unclassified Mucilaginibacter]|uniref:CBS domain-containing protein n=1 Tax=unclassified Mucilaginibacter TaxID=2617802 RepID=UPI0009635F64|nr:MULTISPECIES: CBS domain-containing protein [unclassified Mucilaginibacter]OJW13512.1 MAG: CBS domain-containing protein [Mucilaginibacter sp. 44-25]PLW90638.1 MAG: CBS domain-containing protein [Mucilaginibacter sp.]HEK19874.1 CBS domain-containing protein [Bacteroidota bacterium]
MIAIELIEDAIPPVHTSDTIQKVFDRMAEFRVSHLPIVNEEQFLGLISEDDLIEEPDYNTSIGALAISLVNPYVLEDQHIYDVIRLFYEQQLTVVPVLNQKKDYQGLISINCLAEYFAKLTSVTDPGGIIVLEVDIRNNSLAHMSQVVESDNAQVLSSYTRTFPDSTRMEVTLKVNKQDISNILATFQRYNYEVKATFNFTDHNNNSLDRYDSFMNYLNI